MPNYELAAERAARRAGINPRIFKAMIRAESDFNPNAGSSAGAQGIAQFMPGTAPSYGVNLHDGRVSDDLAGAAKYIKEMLAKSGGNYHQALSMYNAGPGRPNAYKEIPETIAYVKKIMAQKDRETLAGGDVPAGGGGGTPSTTRTVETSSGVDNKAARFEAVTKFLKQDARRDPLAFAVTMKGLQDVAPTTKQVTTPGTSGPSTGSVSPGSLPKGVVKFEGHPVAAWIAPLLRYGRQHGWKGSINSGYRTYEKQKQIYDSGVRPAARPGTSNHEMQAFPGGAVDVNDAATLGRILDNSKYKGLLVWAGSKDPPHLSHPHNGSY